MARAGVERASKLTVYNEATGHPVWEVTGQRHLRRRIGVGLPRDGHDPLWPGSAFRAAAATVAVAGSTTCKAVLSSGKGTCTTAGAALAVCSYDVSATFGGDANLIA